MENIEVKEQPVTTKDLILYYYNECPYCQKVLRKLKEYNLDIELRNTLEKRENYDALKKLNHGITQVPCLVIKGDPMLESDDIIDYLRDNFVKN